MCMNLFSLNNGCACENKLFNLPAKLHKLKNFADEPN